jgi:hypothetical protein
MTGPDHATTSAVDLELLGGALGQRVRDVAAAVRRLDGLAVADTGPAASRPVQEDVREFVLRALRIAGGRDNDVILRAVAAGTSEAAGLAQLTGRPRLALWEAVGDLVQVGLLERDPVADAVRLTAAGTAVLAMVDLLVTAAEAQ